MRHALPLMLLAFALSACAGGGQRPASLAGRDPRYAEVIVMAAEQVKRCYRAPRIPYAGRQIITVLGVHYAPDGSLSALPEVHAQRGVTPDNQQYAPAMAEAASLAVVRCVPLHLPGEYYQGGWDDFELTFSPGAVA